MASRSTKTLAAAGFLCAIATGTHSTGQDVSYRFRPGEELVYEQTSRVDVLEQQTPGAEPTPPSQEYRTAITPIRQNADGSWRLLLRTRFRRIGYDEQDQPYTRFENETLGWCDMSRRGEYAKNPTTGDSLLFWTVPEYVLPPLPDQDAATLTAPATGFDFRRLAARRVGAVTELSLRIASALDARYDNRRVRNLAFDTQQGRPLRITTDSTGGDPDDRFHTRTVVELTDVRTRSAEEVAAYAAAADPYFEARRASWAGLTEASRAATPGACAEAISAASGVISDAADANRCAELDPVFEAMLALREREFAGLLADAAKREALFAREPIDWRAADLEGRVHARSDYRGKVVLLDYWYRGCSHCIKALPKIKRLRQRFADEPVVLLGVNNDRDPADARHVIDAYGIPYTTLRNGLAEPVAVNDPEGEATADPTDTLSDLYGVESWPTFVVLDRSGRVAAVLQGNYDGLEEHLAEAIDHALGQR